jgi:hypothetical protein
VLPADIAITFVSGSHAGSVTRGARPPAPEPLITTGAQQDDGVGVGVAVASTPACEPLRRIGTGWQTSTATALETNDPLPSWPELLFPQQSTVPAAVSAQVWVNPLVTAVMWFSVRQSDVPAVSLKLIGQQEGGGPTPARPGPCSHVLTSTRTELSVVEPMPS